jgi:REP element-mobilizing transposase RayT
MLLSIPPKHSEAQVVGFIKGKGAIHLARVYGERKRNFVGQHFWAWGTSLRRSGVTKRSSGSTSRSRRKKIRDSTSSAFGSETATERWRKS